MWTVKETIGSLRYHPGLTLREGNPEIPPERMVPTVAEKGPQVPGGAAGSHPRLYSGFWCTLSREDLIAKSAGFFSPCQKQSSSHVTETPWRPGTSAPSNGCDQLYGQQCSLKVLCIVNLALYHCQNHSLFNWKAVRTYGPHQTLVMMVHQDALLATRAISVLPRGEFLVKMKVLLRFVSYVDDDNGTVSTGDEWRHPSLPAPGRTPRLAGDACLQDEVGPGGTRKAGRMVAHGQVGVCRLQSLSHCRDSSK